MDSEHIVQPLMLLQHYTRPSTKGDRLREILNVYASVTIVIDAMDQIMCRIPRRSSKGKSNETDIMQSILKIMHVILGVLLRH